MAITQLEAERLFRGGQFLDLLRHAEFTLPRARSYDSATRIFITHALALTGQLGAARELVEVDLSAPNLAVRCRAEIVLGLLNRADGDLEAAERHYQLSVRFAREHGDPEQIAWAHLHLLRLLIDVRPEDAVAALLPEVRRAVTKAGDPRVVAYLHVCISALEGHTGRFNEAMRHCDIADSVLALAPNDWIQGACLLNRLCVAYVMCDFVQCEVLAKRAREAFTRSGHARGIWVVDNNLGQIHAAVGATEKARQNFLRVLTSADPPSFAACAAYDGLARLHLTLDQLDECEDALMHIAGRAPADTVSYGLRVATITRARLLLKRNEPKQALRVLQELESQSIRLRDLTLAATLHLVSAQANMMAGDPAAAAKHLILASECGSTSFREVQAQHYYASAAVLADREDALCDRLRDRADRVWAYQGITSMRSQMDPKVRKDETNSTSNVLPLAATCASVTNSLAACMDLSYSPGLLGSELVTLIAELGCSPGARIVNTRDGSRPSTNPNEALLILGRDHGRILTLACTPPPDPAKAVLLADVLRIGRAALALERARQEERSRAALWPASPAEEQAGALFLAEEMQTLLATARRIASTTVPVLITGETGTGKEVLARMVHAYSTRAAKTFLPFNCSATPKEMLDSQLFGHRRGAFTGASEHFSGVIRAAAGGTLFLDEIGETTLDVQPKLLRFLEASEVHPIGETQPLRVDVRVIAATNADLESLLAAGRFREDLFYRLNIVRLHVPPLRERRVEVPALAHHYLRKHALECDKGDLRLAEETMEYLVLYRWPGNVRQLANEMRRMAAMAEPGAVLMPEHLAPEIAASRRTVPASDRVLEPNEVVVRLDQPMAAALEHLERAMLRHALTACRGRIEETATRLGLSRKGLYLKRQRYGLDALAPHGVEVA